MPIELTFEMMVVLGILAVTTGIAIIAAFMAPQYFQIFFQRLALSNRHYPSDTVIDTTVSTHENLAFCFITLSCEFSKFATSR